MKKKTIFKVLGGLALVLVILGGIAAYLIMSKPYKGAETAYIYIDNDDTKDSVLVKLETIGASTTGFKLLDKVKSYNVRTGKYAITADLSSWNLFRKLRNGQQEAVNMTVPSVRTLDRLAGAMTRNLMIDSLSVLNALQDSAYIAKLGYTPHR